ncbi:MAG: PEP-CTERM sorting domain-containing protein [Planctomycetes bacterium]|nr:PEP-CTERM sorting domain-containing protein [Planctomycetota bacterium]
MVVSFLVVSFAALPASAGLVTWEFEGVVTSFLDGNNLLGGSVSVGTPFSGSFTFDTTTPDSQPSNAVLGVYENAVVSLDGILAGNVFSSLDSLNMVIRNDSPLTVGVLDSLRLSGQAALAGEALYVTLEISDADGAIFSSDSMPLVPPSLEALERADFMLSAQDLFIGVRGDLTALVPEPGTLGMLVFGAIMIFKRRTRRYTRV